MSSLNPGAASFNVNSQTLQFQMTLDPSSNPVIAGDVVTLLTNGNVRRADNGAVVPYTFDSISGSTGNTMASAELSTTTFVVAYKGLNGYLYAVIGTVSGNVIVYGTPVALNAVAATAISVCALSSTSFAVSYTGASNFPNAIVCTVSGSTITAGAIQQINAAATSYSGIAALSSTAFVVTYQGASNFVNAVVCSVSGTTITVNTPAALNSSSSSFMTIAALSSTAFVVAYSAGSVGVAVVATIVGTTITPGTPATLTGTTVGNIRISALDSTDFVVAYFNTNNILAIVCSVAVTTITVNTPVTVLTGAGSVYSALSAISATQFFVGGRSLAVTVSEQVIGVVCSQSGGVITAGTQQVISQEQGATGQLSLASLLLTSGQIIVAYGATESRAISVPYSGLTITYPGIAVNNAIGVASSSATGGNNLNVVSIGVTATNIAYTLTIGTQYYWDSTFGRPTTVAYSYALGIALNTQLLLVARVTGTNQYFG